MSDEKDLDYCFCAKFLVGVPAVFIIAYLASSLVENPFMQVFAGAGAAIAAVYIAMRIEKIPALSQKIIDKDKS